MRKINWRPFKPVDVLHIQYVRGIEMWAYDEKGKLYEADIADPAEERPMLFWAKFDLLHARWRPVELAFTYEGYAFGWAGKRLSSLPEHEYYWRRNIWFTLADRDFLFNWYTRGMFD